MYICTLKFRRGLVNLITVKYVKWILPVVFILYYSSIAIFTHVHVENGTTIVHSHPFKKAAFTCCPNLYTKARACSFLVFS